jgi:quinol monooxygenase YgiN
MADLNVVAVIKAKEGREGVVGDALKSIIGPSRKDKGCNRYDLYVAEGAPGTFVTIEAWASQEDINEHMKSPHLAAGFTTVGDAFDGAPQIYLLNPVDVA